MGSFAFSTSLGETSLPVLSDVYRRTLRIGGVSIGLEFANLASLLPKKGKMEDSCSTAVVDGLVPGGSVLVGFSVVRHGGVSNVCAADRKELR